MLKCLKAFDVKKSGIFAAGVLFGTAGVKVLASKEVLYQLHRSCSSRKDMCPERSSKRTGKCRGHLR